MQHGLHRPEHGGNGGRAWDCVPREMCPPGEKSPLKVEPRTPMCPAWRLGTAVLKLHFWVPRCSRLWKLLEASAQTLKHLLSRALRAKCSRTSSFFIWVQTEVARGLRTLLMNLESISTLGARESSRCPRRTWLFPIHMSLITRGNFSLISESERSVWEPGWRLLYHLWW